MNVNETKRDDPDALALAALGWILTDADRARRLLSLTGLSPDHLRDRLEDPALLASILSFLEAYEPDLTACASALGLAPSELVGARRMLEA
jgi:hypothetical protein